MLTLWLEQVLIMECQVYPPNIQELTFVILQGGGGGRLRATDCLYHINYCPKT